MRRSTSIGWGKLWVGALVMFALAALLYVSFSGGGTSIFQGKKVFTAYFRNVNGLLKGSPVWMSGVEVGNVKDVEFVNIDSLRQVKVTARVREDLWVMVTEGSRVQVGTIGFLGDKYIDILPGPVGGIPIEEGAELPVHDAGDAQSLFKAGEAALNKTGAVVSGLDTLLDRVNRGEGTIGKLASRDEFHDRSVEMLASLTRLTDDLQRNQERLTSSIESMAISVGSLSDKLQGEGTVGRLINDPKLYDNLNASTARLDSVLALMKSDSGNVGLLVTDTALYVEVVNLLHRLNNLVTDIQANPKKYFDFSVF